MARSSVMVLLVFVVTIAACSDSSDGSVSAAAETTRTESSLAPTAPTTAYTNSTSTSAAAAPTPTPTPTAEGNGPDPTLIYSNYVRTETLGTGLALDIHAPGEIGPWPVVVTIHGGGWFVGDRTSMGPLADGLAGRKVVAFNASYRTLSVGGVFPGMVDDIACAVQYAREAASEFTTSPDLVTVVGHSAGAHLSSLVAYAPGIFGQDCAGGPSRSPDAFVGLAGPYDIYQVGGLLSTMFGGTITEMPEAWAAGNPFTWIADSPDIPTLLIHGDADQVAPVAFSEELEEALRLAGRSVTLEILPGRSHSDAASPRVVADRIVRFLSDLESPG